MLWQMSLNALLLCSQDVDGWRKLCERLGSKCLLVADRVLEKGLPLSPAPFQGDTEDGATHQTELGVDYLSCATVPLQSTLSGTIDKANDMKSVCTFYKCTTL